jgi:hypothetical protein
VVSYLHPFHQKQGQIDIIVSQLQYHLKQRDKMGHSFCEIAAWWTREHHSSEPAEAMEDDKTRIPDKALL